MTTRLLVTLALLSQSACSCMSTEQSFAQTAVGTWNRVELDGAVCSDGTPFAIFSRKGTTDDVVVHLWGGGMCWDERTCRDPIPLNELIFGSDSFYFPHLYPDTIIPSALTGMFELREDNPVADWTVVFVPYCTADFHLGRAARAYGDLEVQHTGALNVERALDWVEREVPRDGRLLLSGDSAGGYAVAHWAARVNEQLTPTEGTTVLIDAAVHNAARYPEIIDETWSADLEESFGFAPGARPVRNALTAHAAAGAPLRFLHMNTTQDATLARYQAELNDEEPGAAPRSPSAPSWASSRTASS
jgi:hypothetical protein